MLTESDLEELKSKLQSHADNVCHDDDIMAGLVQHLIRQIDANMTQLWFYGKAMKARRNKPHMSFGISSQDAVKFFEKD